MAKYQDAYDMLMGNMALVCHRTSTLMVFENMFKIF